MITFETAKSSDIPEISALFEKARKTLNTQSILQWPPHYPSEIEAKKDVAAQELIVGRDKDGQIVGCFTVNEDQSPEYKQVAWKYGENAIVAILHRLVIDPDFQGRGLGKVFMSEIEAKAKKMNASALRLDTFLANKASNALYLKMNYQLANGCCFFHGRKIPFLCYEKNLKATKY